MSLKITIVIPVYNVSPYISACLDSVFAQTYQGPMECILVDDCGTDDSMNIVRRVVDGYNGPIQLKILHHEHNRGLSAARNTGMNAATGDYIYFLDSDDEITPDCIEKLAEPLNEELFDLVVGNIKTIGNEQLNKSLQLKLTDGATLGKEEIQHTYRTKWNVMAQNKLYRLNFLRDQNLLFKEGLIHEDELWSLQVSCVAQSLKVVAADTYLYYLRQNSITANSNMAKKAEALKVIVSEMKKFLLGRRIFSAPAYFLVQNFVGSILSANKHEKEKFIEAYLYLRKNARFPLSYRFRAYDFNLRLFRREIYYLLPPQIAAYIMYYRMRK